MVKKFTLMFLLGIFGLFSTNLFAQEDATIDPSQIKYWIGEGDNEVVFIANWAEPDTALAWGYRFSTETVTVKDMMLDIQATDYRFGFVGESFVSDVTFNDGVLDLKLAGMWWMYNVNGVTAGEYFDVQTVSNGDWVKFGDESCGIIIDPVMYTYVWTKEVAPVYALADEAMIDPSEIVYWIGEGENSAIFAVNFADPEDVCYAWGYRFSTESVTIKEMMQAIAEVDLRFAFTDEPSSWGGYMLTDLTFNYEEVDYNLNGYNAMYNLNGMQSWFTFDEQTVVNGDFVKWGDYTIGTEIAPWTYVWETPVQPVSEYFAVEEVEATMLSVYPNPATETLYVNAENVQSVEIYDMTGRIVMTSTMSVVDLRGVEAGVYFVTVKSGNATKTTKLVVK
jgi:hypothetical protein